MFRASTGLGKDKSPLLLDDSVAEAVEAQRRESAAVEDLSTGAGRLENHFSNSKLLEWIIIIVLIEFVMENRKLELIFLIGVILALCVVSIALIQL